MEFLGSTLKAALLLPVYALIEAPLVQLSTRILRITRPTFWDAYRLVLIVGAALFVVGLILWPVLPEENSHADLFVTLLISAVGYGWAYGYFLRNGDGTSIGYWRGTQVFVITGVLFFAILLVVGLVIFGASVVLGT